MLRSLPLLPPFFDRFLLPTSPPKPQKSLKLDGFYKVFCKMGLSKLTSIFDAILVPTCFHFASQNPSKPLQKPTPRGIKKLIDFCFDFLFLFHFGSQVGPFAGHVGFQKSARNVPNVAQDALKRQKAPKRRPDSQNDPKITLQSFQNDPPGPPKWPSRPPKIESMRCQISFSLTHGGGNAACRAEDKVGSGSPGR